MQVKALYSYPLKSAAGISYQEVSVNPMGLPNDRHWMIANPEGKFLTGRQFPEMVLIQVTIASGGLHLSAPNMSDLIVSLEQLTTTSAAHVWGQDFTARSGCAKANEWLSHFLNTPAQLMYIGELTTRFRDGSTPLSFADGYPILLAGQSSLDELNQKLESPVDMRQFRPNIVIDGAPAFEEDFWTLIQIGEVELAVKKYCERCVFTTVNPDTGEKSPDNEPLTTLSGFRNIPEKGICFGQNLEVVKSGTIRVGDEVTILDWAF
ncbi:MOSC domain-containing protein [Leeia sp. TBRC 13508]|uniref:MOSC domain-containing protein n=1 Tax=Leeia speluncae TaxID=2884804 RepID=A0ABS8D831_9NEIS|nr:MOSC domain-containing protein [Leeia speluncae]MCB6184358.1 MOSC domain-containing protein [Leeia speluncae]